MKTRKQYLFYFLLSLAGVVLFLAAVYSIIDYVAEESAEESLKYRGIDSGIKLLLNGYLGHFFKFQYLGNINWIAIPILVYCFATFRRRSKWEQAFLFFYTLVLLVIAVKGYFNARYMLTLFPVTVLFIAWHLWKFFERPEARFLRKYAFATLLVLALFNSARYKVRNIFAFSGEKPAKSEVSFLEKLKKKFANSDYLMARVLVYGRDMVFRYSSNPEKMTAYINQMELDSGSAILSNNLPILYYTTDKKVVYYWCGDDRYYTENGALTLFEGRDAAEVADFLRNRLRCNYIFTLDYYNPYNKDFELFLENECVLVMEEYGYELYQLKDAQ